VAAAAAAAAAAVAAAAAAAAGVASMTPLGMSSDHGCERQATLMP
jgi:hypothetical protein